MNFEYFVFKNNDIESVKGDVDIKDWLHELNWVIINSNNRNELTEYLSKLNISEELMFFINNPEKSLLSKSDSKLIIQNFSVFTGSDNHEHEYITLIIYNSVVISILPENIKINIKHSEYLRGQFSDLRYYFLYLIGGQLLNQSTVNISTSRKSFKELKQAMIDSPGKLSSSNVLDLLNKIGRLSDVIEDQYVSFDFFIKILPNVKHEFDIKKLKEIVSSLSELNRMAERLEDNVESLRTQFMLIHQEESARKINVLTIIQAIFVPLTFIAGVYGMNFKFMPELEIHNAYYVVWGVFLVIAIMSLYFFKRNKWFD